MGTNFTITGKPKGTGVGFYVNKGITNKIEKYRGISERIGVMKVKIYNKIKVTIIQVYAPTAEAEEAEIEKFYQDLGSTVTKEK